VCFQIGITPDFLTHAAGLLEPALAEIFDPASGVKYDWMPDTAGVGVAEILDGYDAVIALDYRFPAESFRGVRRLTAGARHESANQAARRWSQ
jgi:hypothetical protein